MSENNDDHMRSHEDNIYDFSPPNEVRLNATSLGYKYRPKHFRDIVGHEITIKAISNAAEKKKIALVYLFHGPSGTGKSSTATIFAMALNCASTTKSCWSCCGCSRSFYRVAGLERIRTILHTNKSYQGFKVIIIECHLFRAQAWDEFMGIILQESYDYSNVVFVLITAAANEVPTNVSSRCQMFGFPRLKDEDIALKVEKILAREDMGIEREAVKLIIVKSQGSLREAENILDQLALLGSTITSSMVQQLVGLAPRNKLVDLLATAVSGDTNETIRLAKDLMTCVEPQTLVSQLASLITDILPGAVVADPFSPSATSKANTRSARLCHALKVLVETERQLRCSTEKTSGVLAALLEISSLDVYNRSIVLPRNITAQSDGKPNDESENINLQKILHRSSLHCHTIRTPEILDVDMIIQSKSVQSMHKPQRFRDEEAEKTPTWAHMGDMEKIWQDMLEKVQSTRMKDFLFHQVKLASLSVSRANAIVHLMFKRTEDKIAAQMSEESISKALQIAIGCPVTVNMSLEPIALEIEEENKISTQTHLMDFKQHQRIPFSPEFIQRRNFANLVKAPESSSLYENSMLRKLKECSPSGENQFDTSADPEGEILTREITSIEKASNKPKHRRLSLSSLPQIDVSVEPYSQDILFEKANSGREHIGRRNRNCQKGFSKPIEDHHSRNGTIHAKLNRSWSCIEKLRPKKTTV